MKRSFQGFSRTKCTRRFKQSPVPHINTKSQPTGHSRKFSTPKLRHIRNIPYFHVVKNPSLRYSRDGVADEPTGRAIVHASGKTPTLPPINRETIRDGMPSRIDPGIRPVSHSSTSVQRSIPPQNPRNSSLRDPIFCVGYKTSVYCDNSTSTLPTQLIHIIHKRNGVACQLPNDQSEGLVVVNPSGLLTCSRNSSECTTTYPQSLYIQTMN